MSEYIHKSHNVTVLLRHLVFPAKYRRPVIDDHVDVVLKEICLETVKRYQVKFLEIGTDKDHVHFLVQSLPTYRNTSVDPAADILGLGKNWAVLAQGISPKGA
jgi:REP element-mobilizing transposase RayT